MPQWNHPLLRKVVAVIAYAYGVAGVAYLLLKALDPVDLPLDFPFFWVAGELWNAGVSPYSEAYATASAPYHGQYAVLKFYYPPNWWLITSGIALFDLKSATTIWLVLNAALAAAGGVLLFRVIKLREPSTPVCVLFAIVGFVATMQETALTLYFGQSSILLFFGMCALLYGMSSGFGHWVILGCVICLLKPQLGLVVWPSLLVWRQWRVAAVVSAIVTAALMAPPIIVAGFTETVFGFLQNVAHYANHSDGAHAANVAAVTTGARHLVFDMTGNDLSSLYFVVAAVFISIVFTALQHVSKGPAEKDAPHSPETIVCGFVLLASAIVSLHGYDHVIIASIIPFLFFVRSAPLRFALAAGLIILYRPLNLANITGWRDAHSYLTPQAHLESITTLFMLTCFTVWLVRRQSAGLRQLFERAAQVKGRPGERTSPENSS